MPVRFLGAALNWGKGQVVAEKKDVDLHHLGPPALLRRFRAVDETETPVRQSHPSQSRRETLETPVSVSPVSREAFEALRLQVESMMVRLTALEDRAVTGEARKAKKPSVAAKPKPVDGKPWVAAGVSRAAWYRQRAKAVG